MRENISKVKRYKEFFEKNYPSYKFDPYTVIRHCLYLGEKDLFERLLTAQHSEVFDAWLANNS